MQISSVLLHVSFGCPSSSDESRSEPPSAVDPDPPVSALLRRSNESTDCDRIRLCFFRPLLLTFGFLDHLLNEDGSEIEESDLVSSRDDEVMSASPPTTS